MGRGFDPDRLDRVKREIGVTAAQEQAWTKYTGTLKEVADARRARRDSIDRSAIARMSTDEFRKFRDSMIEQRRKEQDQVRAAVDSLVASLDEKQVAIAKEVLPGFAFGRMGGMGMGMGGMGMNGMGGGMGMGRNR
jgi:predicted component of type VI protein secretion system